MEHLYPKETVQNAAEKAILSDNFGEVIPVLQTLLRQQKKRDDLVPTLASLITSSNIRVKFLRLGSHKAKYSQQIPTKI